MPRPISDKFTTCPKCGKQDQVSGIERELLTGNPTDIGKENKICYRCNIGWVHDSKKILINHYGKEVPLSNWEKVYYFLIGIGVLRK
jgi:hypothetical protein